MNRALGSESWPRDLLFLRDRHPRAGWADNPALGDLAKFWLYKHDTLRAQGAGLNAAAAELREGRMPSSHLQSRLAPALGQFLQALEGHHQVEDQHYFPIFRSAEPRIALGIEILESDHALIHEQVLTAVDAARALLRSADLDRDRLLSAADRYATASDALTRSLAVHLTDEEDLVIPLLASRFG